MKFKPLDFQLFSEVSQDNNPLHQEGIVFGMQLLAYVEGELMCQLGLVELTRIDYRFRQPLYYGEEFQLLITGSTFQVVATKGVLGEGSIDGR